MQKIKTGSLVIKIQLIKIVIEIPTRRTCLMRINRVNTINKWIIVMALAIISNSLYAQYKYTRYSLDINGGLSLPQTSISKSPSGFSWFSEVGFKLTTSHYLSGRLSFGLGSAEGRQTVETPQFPPNNVSNYTSYKTNYYYLTGSAYLNLERVFDLRSERRFKRTNPYLVIGGGYMFPDVRVEGIYGQRKRYNENIRFITNNFGLEIKHYLSNRFDLTLGVEYRIIQTYYFDGAYTDKKYDNLINGYAGISYNIGANADKKHMDWFNLDNRRDIIFAPQEEEKKPDSPIVKKEQPIIPDTSLAIVDKPIDTPEDTTNYEGNEPIVMEEVIKDSAITVVTPNNQEPIVVAIPDAPRADSLPVKKTGRHPDLAGNKPIQKQIQTDTATKLLVTKQSKPARSRSFDSTHVVIVPKAKYNVIVACYRGTKYAFLYSDFLRSKGYQTQVLRSNPRSKMLRVSVYFGDDKQEANKALRRYLREFKGQAWIHVYNQPN